MYTKQSRRHAMSTPASLPTLLPGAALCVREPFAENHNMVSNSGGKDAPDKSRSKHKRIFAHPETQRRQEARQRDERDKHYGG